MFLQYIYLKGQLFYTLLKLFHLLAPVIKLFPLHILHTFVNLPLFWVISIHIILQRKRQNEKNNCFQTCLRELVINISFKGWHLLGVAERNNRTGNHIGSICTAVGIACTMRWIETSSKWQSNICCAVDHS